MAKFNIINKVELVVNYVLVITDKAPKKLRCDIVPEMRKSAFRIMEDIVRANCQDIATKSERRLEYQEDALATIRVLEIFAESCYRQSYITEKQLGFLSKLTQELYDMIQNWIISDSKRR